MSRLGRFLLGAVLAAASVSYVGACTDSTGSDTITQAELQSYLASNAAASSVAIIDGLTRVVTAIGGGGADGVTIVPVGNAVNTDIMLDMDGDGTRETTVSGTATFSSSQYDLSDGATFAITGIQGSSMENAAGSAEVSSYGGMEVELAGSAEFNSSDGPTVDITEFGVTVVPFSNYIYGWADVEVGGQVLCITFEDDGSGGWQMRVEGDDYEFVI